MSKTEQRITIRSSSPWVGGSHRTTVYLEDDDGHEVRLTARREDADHWAALFAAAPALLEALESVIDQLEGIGIPDWHGAEGLCLESARQALAQARGEEK